MDTSPLLLVYDGECPACSAYTRMVRVRESVGELRLVDARQDSEVLREITAAGLDIDEGMVLKMEGQLYYGEDAVHALALISSRVGLFNRLNHRAFSSPWVSALIYPLLKACRNGLLRLLGRAKIDNLGR